MVKKVKHKIAAGVFIVAILLVGTVLVMKPKQQQVTEEILTAKEQNDDEYFDFIANNLQGGGPPKDGIPAIDSGKYLKPEEAETLEGLKDEDIIFGVNYEGKILALPQEILYWHEIVNEKTEDGRDFSVTYCPLTGTVIGYLDHNLGVSGKLYNSNLVMYDRENDDYYPQILGKAVTGNKGKTLSTFPVTVTTWKQWKDANPDTLVLSRDTGYRRAYDDPPYQGYERALQIWFPVAAKSDEFHSKKIIHGIEYDGKAYTVLKENIDGELEYKTENDILRITYNNELDAVEVTADSGKEVKHFDGYWFAWYAYHPDTVVINGGET